MGGDTLLLFLGLLLAAGLVWRYSRLRSTSKVAQPQTPQQWQRLAEQDRAAWMQKSIHAFQEMAFFADLYNLPDDHRIERVTARVEQQWDTLFPVDPARHMQLADMYLLSADHQRVWWRDLEVVLPGVNAYEQVLNEWAQISRGAFAPTDAVEQWEQQSARIIYQLGGNTYNFDHPAQAGDFLHLGILSRINRHIAPSGYQFAVSDAGGMPNFIFVLTPGEKTRLSHNRGWRFYSLPAVSGED